MPGGRPASFYLSPSFKGRRVMSLDLHDGAFDPVFAYAAQVAADRPVQDVVRELVLQAISLDAGSAAVRAARSQAYREAKRDVLSRISAHLRILAVELDLEPAGSAEGPQPENYIAPAGDSLPVSSELAL